LLKVAEIFYAAYAQDPVTPKISTPNVALALAVPIVIVTRLEAAAHELTTEDYVLKEESVILQTELVNIVVLPKV
jgi:hypothetical protein